jgi:tetratricopeptide (TPR) repeat protein
LGEVVVLSLLPALQDGRRRAWLLVPVIVLWANLHAGAFVGPVIIALAGLGLVLEGVIDPARASRPAVFRHALATTLGTAALMATPVGPGIFRYLTFHANIFAIHPVDEFRPPSWSSDAHLLLYAAGLAFILGLGAALRARPRARDVLPVLGLALLAGCYVRFAADFALLAAILVAPVLAGLSGRWSTRIAPTYRAHFERATGALLALLAFLPRMGDIERHGRFLDIDLYRANLPLAALDFVDQHGLRERMYNDFETGAFLIWQGYPRYRVFVDPRLPAYPREFHQLLGRSEISRAEWTRNMDHFGVTSALLDYAGVNRRVAWWDPEDWALVFRAQDNRVFVRRLPRLRDLIAHYEIPASFTFTAEEGSAILPLDTPPAGSPVPLCEWQIRLGDLYFDLDPVNNQRVTDAYRAALTGPPGCLTPEQEAAACAWLGSVDRAAGRHEQALALLDRSLAIVPDDTAVLSNRALALEALDRPREAAETWSRIAALAGDSPFGRIARKRARSLTR